MFSWSLVARAFQPWTAKIAASGYPLVGFFLVEMLSGEDPVFDSRFCAIIDCASQQSQWMNIAIFIDTYMIIFIYYFLLMFSLSYYVYLVYCWPPIKKHVELVNILIEYSSIDSKYVGLELRRQLGDQGKLAHAGVEKLLVENFNVKNYGWAATLANLLFMSGVIGLIGVGILNIYVVSCFIYMVLI